MSKVSFSRELLGTIRFIFDKTKSRTLNATQAYDSSTSQIVLGSFPASATKKLLTKDLGVTEIDSGFDSISGTVAGRFTAAGGEYLKLVNLGRADREAEPAIAVPTSANVSFAAYGGKFDLKKSKKTSADPGQASTVTFGGIVWYQSDLPAADTKKSNATKDIFYGAITVGTGDYRAWQGKYAVLKVDLLTNKAILRVYNE